MVDSSDFQKAVELISKSNSILITTHTRPDGDGCGCIAAICDTLTTLGKKVKPVLLSSVTEWYGFLFEQKPEIFSEKTSIDSDLIIIVVTNTYNQLPKFDEYLKQTDKPVLVIDHHVTTDGLGDVELIDTAAAATTLIIFELLKYADWPITEKIAEALFVGVATDTGWFRFPNTDSRAVRVCAELIDAGVKPTKIYHDLYQNFSFQRLKLMTAMLNTLELHLDGRFATQHLSQTDFKQAGAEYNDTENLIDECQRISSVEAAALFVELADGRIKASLRSRGAIDVRKIAQKFSGGGHTKASGAHLSGPLEHAKKLIFDQIAEQFKQLDSK